MDSPRTASTTFAVLTIAIVVPLALGQPTTSELAPAPRSTGLAVLDAFVTDASGAAVQGLRAGEFEVTQDGTPVLITGVFGPRLARGTRSPSGDPRGQETLVVVFVDPPATMPSQRISLLAKGESVVSDRPWGSGVRVMVAWRADTVTVRQPFTADAQLVLQACRAVESLAEVSTAPARESGQARPAPVDLASFVESLRGLPGRKALLYVGDPESARLGDANATAATDPFRALADQVNAADVTFYSFSETGSGGSEGMAAPQVRQDVGQGAAAERDARSAKPLEPLLLATGGRTVGTSGGVADAIADVVRDVRGAYSLGFAAPSHGDGAMHQVRVRVKREGVSARARSAFLDLKDDDRMAERTLAALLFGVADNPLGIQVSATTEPKPKEGTQLVTILVSVPLGNLAFAPRAVSHDCDLELWLAARDREGQVIRAPKAKFPVSVPNDRLLTALTQTAGYTFRVPLKAGGGTFAVTVRDEIAMQAATELTVLAPAAEPSPGVTP